VAEALKRRMGEKGLPTGENVLVGSASPNPNLEGKVRAAYGAHFVEVAVDTDLGHVRVMKYLAVHDSGRIMNPLTARSQIKGGVLMGIGMALHEDLIYDRRNGQPLTAGFYGARLLTHRDAPEIEGSCSASDAGYGPY